MRTVFLTGGTGFVGGAVLRYLSRNTSHRLIAGVRKHSSQIPESVTQVVGGQNQIRIPTTASKGMETRVLSSIIAAG